MSSSDKALLDDNSILISDLPNDTEAAIRYIKTLLPVKYPPIVFVHQLHDIIYNKTLIIKELGILQNQCKIQQLVIGSSNSPALMFYDDYAKYTLNIYPENSCVNKFVNTVLPSIKSSGVDKCTLKQKFRLQQYELTELINCGILLIKNDAANYWISFPSASKFIRSYNEGRKYIIQIIKRRKFQEILENDLEVRCAKVSKVKELGFKYFLHDIKGSMDIEMYTKDNIFDYWFHKKKTWFDFDLIFVQKVDDVNQIGIKSYAHEMGILYSEYE